MLAALLQEFFVFFHQNNTFNITHYHNNEELLPKYFIKQYTYIIYKIKVVWSLKMSKANSSFFVFVWS